MLLATLRFHERPGRDGFKVHCATVLWDAFQHGGKFVPKTIPQCTLTSISTGSPVQPQNGEYEYLEIVRQLGPACISRVHGDESSTCRV